MEDYENSPPSARSKPSKIPSWIMLGFLLGGVSVWTLQRPRASAPSRPAPTTPVLSAPPAPVSPRFTAVEASFAEWQQYAVWAGELTYVVVWDGETKSFRDCYEVLRRGNDVFFRSVSRPENLRPIESVPENSPLQFLNPVPEVPRGLFGLPAGAKRSAPPAPK